MNEKKEELLQTASRLYSLGVETDSARERLRRLLTDGGPCSASSVLAALQEYETLNERWKALEQKYLALKAEICKAEP